MMTAPLRTGEPVTVNVALGSRAYDIAIGRGLIAELGTRIAALKPGASAAIVSDETVAARHLKAAEAALDAAGIRAVPIVVPPGEASKSWHVLEDVCDRLLDARIERNDVVVALGGGVVGDLSGFAASILRRGLDVVQVPTTLLAQVELLGRRQDRHQFQARQEPCRRVPSADPGGRRHGAARHLAGARFPRRLCGGREIRPARRCGLLRLARGELAGRVRRRARARACDRDRVPRQGRHRGARRARDRRARALQSRPHVRPRLRGGGGLFRPAAARRSGRARHRLRVRIFRPARASAAGRSRARGAPPCGGRPADPHPPGVQHACHRRTP